MSSVLHVDLDVKAGAEEALTATFDEVFRPAIRRQDGFRRVALLRPAEPGPYRLALEFEEEAQRLRWVESDLHQRVWPQMESHCSSYAPHLFREDR
jgi:heme-degrading monooxygenase HmoA